MEAQPSGPRRAPEVALSQDATSPVQYEALVAVRDAARLAVAAFPFDADRSASDIDWYMDKLRAALEDTDASRREMSPERDSACGLPDDRSLQRPGFAIPLPRSVQTPSCLKVDEGFPRVRPGDRTWYGALVTALQTCLHQLGEEGYFADPDYPEINDALALYNRIVGA